MPFRKKLLLAFLIATIVVSGGTAVHADPVMAGFLEQHCIKCHGPDKQKAKLRLDTLQKPSLDPETWNKILEAVEYGDMPPAEEKTPPDDEISAFRDVLGAALIAAKEKPSIALRRMNRREYENTIQDLLGIDASLAEILPQDGRKQGFDNVAEGLPLSAVLMEKYLEAANAAFDAMVRRSSPGPVETRRQVAMELEPNARFTASGKHAVLEKDGSFVDQQRGWPSPRWDGANVAEDGIYRCRIAVWPYEAGDLTLSVEVFTGPLYGAVQLREHGFFDVTGTAAQPRIIEFTTKMEKGDTFHIEPSYFRGKGDAPEKGAPRPGVGMVWVETQGPLDRDFPSLPQKRFFGESPTISMVPISDRSRIMKVHSTAPREDAERIIRNFIPQAFRRPVAKEIADPYVDLVLAKLTAGRPFEDSLRAGFSAILCSPRFLLINRMAEVDDFELASRMSYFLWSSMPDGELLDLAAKGKLSDAAVRRDQADRMLEDPKAERFVENFTGQWLDLREIDATVPDKRLFPEFDPLLRSAMLGETKGFFREFLEKDIPVTKFVNANFSVLNERIADHYGIEGVKGNEDFQVVELPEDSLRGGLLSQASIMKVTANGNNSSPVLRGVWVLDRLMGQPVPPPPPGAGTVEPDIRGAVSLRDQFSKHTDDPSCARCHVRIDPVGFALEEFDPTGKHRERYRGMPKKGGGYVPSQPVESFGTLPDGHSFTDFRGFRDWLAGHGEDVAFGFARKLLIYGCGRSVEVTDRHAVEDLLKATERSGHGLRSMVKELVAGEFFTKP